MQIKRALLSLIIGSCVTTSFADSNISPVESTSQSSCTPDNPKSSDNYNAVKWYRDSAERNAQYNQIFSIGLEKITQKVKQDKLKKNQWGAIFDIDETVLDNTEYEKRNVISCKHYDSQSMYEFMEEKVSPATPGAVNITCGIQKLGGQVVLVTNRDGTFDDKIQQATIDNLKSEGICFNSIIFADGESAVNLNKTPRFNAVQQGNYKDIITTNSNLKPLKIIAYFGDNIQDFPNTTQAQALKEQPNSKFFNKFGQEYFSLPNPTYGSWEKNQFN